MGVFDSLYDAAGHEWQTRAFARRLDSFRLGDPLVPSLPLTDFQVEVFGGPGPVDVDAYATVRDGVLVEVPDERDPGLPLLDYHGRLEDPGSRSPGA